MRQRVPSEVRIFITSMQWDMTRTLEPTLRYHLPYDSCEARYGTCRPQNQGSHTILAHISCTASGKIPKLDTQPLWNVSTRIHF